MSRGFALRPCLSLGCGGGACACVPWYRYKRLHKPHHLWKNPTPWASHAFHPLDGWLQGTAYHIFVVFFPMHKVVHLLALVFVNVWTNSIHDGCSFFPWSFINGAAHHTIHHTDFHYNYGQYFVFWDWVFGSYRDPREEVGVGLARGVRCMPRTDAGVGGSLPVSRRAECSTLRCRRYTRKSVPRRPARRTR